MNKPKTIEDKLVWLALTIAVLALTVIMFIPLFMFIGYANE